MPVNEACFAFSERTAAPAFLERLVDLLHDPDKWMRSSTAEVVGWFGEAAATSLILECLADLLRAPDKWVRSGA